MSVKTSTLEIEAAMERQLADGVTLSGRVFARPASTTFQHDAFTMKQMRESGIYAVASRFNPATDDMTDLATTVIVDAFDTGRLFSMLSAALVEKGTQWTPERAAANAVFFSNLSDPIDKAALRDFIPWVLLNFFLNADDSWRTSLKSSASIGGGTSHKSSLALAGASVAESGPTSSES